MSFAVKQIDHIELCVSDIESVAAWYQKVLGLKVTHRFEPEPLMLGNGGTHIALFRGAPPRRPQVNSADTKLETSNELGLPHSCSNGSATEFRNVAFRTDRAGFDHAQRHLAKMGVNYRGPID